jgi:hypothetical protein
MEHLQRCAARALGEMRRPAARHRVSRCDAAAPKQRATSRVSQLPAIARPRSDHLIRQEGGHLSRGDSNGTDRYLRTPQVVERRRRVVVNRIRCLVFRPWSTIEICRIDRSVVAHRLPSSATTIMRKWDPIARVKIRDRHGGTLSRSGGTLSDCRCNQSGHVSTHPEIT